MKKGIAAIIAVVVVAACAAGMWYSHQKKIEAMQNDGAEKLRASINLDDYREAEQKEITKILDSTEAAIRESEDQEEIDSLIAKASEDFSEFKTDAQYTKEEEEEAARQAELERQRQEEEAAAAAAAAAAAEKKSSKKSSGSGGCVGGGSDMFY